MSTFNYNKWNTILGWLAFAVALVTYTLTVEPTMSFWDCGEYIATSAKLEVGHPPGAPLYQMLGAFFAMFAVGKENIALMVNMMSVFSSAFTILFLFWSSTMILKKLVASYTETDKNNSLMILGASFIGALAFTFSDSFWFNAVEAEVYAMATLFIALLLWLGLRWEQDMDSPKANRWLLLISLIIGLSFGVHFMALLTIPSIGFLYYFKNYKTVTIKSFIIANVVIVAVLLFIFKLLLPYTLAFFGKTEIFMVNSLGLPFDSGSILALIAIVAFFIYGLKYTKQKGHPFYNTILLCTLFVLIGFSTWMMLPIRANANTPINENKPSDAAEVLAYYNREQYGVNPLFYGPQFTDEFAGLDPDNPYLDKAPNYERDYKTGKYVIVNDYIKAEQNTDDAHKALLPRMWSTEHVKGYINFSGLPKFEIKPEYAGEKELIEIVAEFRNAYATKKIDNDDYVTFLRKFGEYLDIKKPTFFENISFMVEYQFGYMYGRYLLWNFVGRQNDNQGRYDNLDGNWMSGIKFIDELHLGSQDNLPSDVLNNKGRNFYYFLPFILGLIGLMYHAQRDLKSFYVLLALFLFTGLALKIYLNERPFEPRERDYALVGSFYVFAIWIGFGVYAIYEIVKEKIAPKMAGPLVLIVSLIAVPGLMAFQNWDDHDRSGKYTAIAMAKQYLDSCEPNAILYTIGDNDTFPLWYAQEIEGYRTDVKLCCTSLLMTDWYIDQMKNKTYNSDGLDITFDHSQYVGDNRDGILFSKQTENRWDIKSFIAFAKSETNVVEMESGKMLHYLPTNKVRIPIDKNQIIKNKIVNPKFNDSIVPYIDIDISGNVLYKNRLIMLDVLANNNWKRPIYFSPGSFGDDDYLWMKDYMQLDGMVYKLVPVKTPFKEENYPDMGQIDTDKMYNTVMKFDWGNGESTKIYHDPETRRNSISTRNNLSRLMYALIDEGKKDKAKKIIDLAINKTPLEFYGYYSTLNSLVDGYYKVGEKEKAHQLLDKIMKKYQENISYYKTFKPSEQAFLTSEIMTDLYHYKNLLKVMKDNKDTAYYLKNKTTYNSFNKLFEQFGGEEE
jgi:tetratricopeptide (TPR) repeat protein/flagellar biogenesis protein FliO